MTRISMLESVRGRYVVATDTPDNGRSTFPECWGVGHRWDTRAVFASDSLGEARTHAETYGDDAKIYDRSTGRPVGAKRLAELEAC